MSAEDASLEWDATTGPEKGHRTNAKRIFSI